MLGKGSVASVSAKEGRRERIAQCRSFKGGRILGHAEQIQIHGNQPMDGRLFCFGSWHRLGAGRFLMTHDGVSYLDMGDAYLRGDWHTAINCYFNPLYAWIQALARFVLRPSMYWEYPVVHLVNYGIFVVTVFAFEYFLQGLLKDREDVFAIRLRRVFDLPYGRPCHSYLCPWSSRT